jgi:hypothetical protein
MYTHHPGGFHLEYNHPQAETSSLSPQQMVGPNHTHSTSLIGRPIHFGDGQFAGQTIRAELHEVQKADLGRKWVLVDFFLPVHLSIEYYIQL